MTANTEAAEGIISSRAARTKALSIGVSTSAAYMAAYIAKSLLGAITPEIKEAGIYTGASIGMMGSCFFVLYAAGQLINGILGDMIKPRYMITIGLAIGSVLCFVFPFLNSSLIAYVLWACCGYGCSMLWGPMSKLVAENTDEKKGRVLLLLLTAASIAGSMIAYVLASLCSSLLPWRFAFYIGAAVMALCAVLSNVLLGIAERKKMIVAQTVERKKDVKKSEHGKMPLGALIRESLASWTRSGLILAGIALMCNGVIRNAASFWIPTYINETFNVSTGLASAVSSIMPIVNLLGAVVTYRLLKYFHDNEHILSMLCCVLSVIMFVLLYITGNRSLVAAVVFLTIATSCMSGMCNLYFSVYVLRFAESGRTSSVTGALDCLAYVASAAANPAIGLIAERSGWGMCVVFWIIVCGLGAVLCFANRRNVGKMFLRSRKAV